MTRSFCYRTFIAGWRAACAAQGLNPATGTPLELEAVYRTDLSGRRCIVRVPILPDPDPEPLCDPASRDWWAQPSLWDNPGAHHSVVEAQAFASIAAQARARAGVKAPETLDMALAREFRAIVREVLAEEIPLRELHRRRGVEVISLEGVRIEVRKKTA